MAMYRCAACGSSHVVVDKKKEGFSVSKAAIGTALFGAGGAAMGINSKEQLYYHCAACGQTLSYPMLDFKKESIDKWLASPETFAYMLRIEKKQYPNIEWNENNTIASEGSIQITESPSENDLADAVWSYYLRNRIPYVSIQTLGKEVLKDNYYKTREVLEILENRGVITIEKKDDAHYCSFYSDAEEIKKNLYNIQIRSDEEKEAAYKIKATCTLELSRLRRTEYEEKKQKTEERNQLVKDAILKALSGDVTKTITEMMTSCDECAPYSNVLLSAVSKQMIDAGLVEKHVENNKSYFSLAGARRRTEEKKRQQLYEEKMRRIEEAKEHNKKINEQIAVLQKEKSEQETIVEQNALKLFGVGAQAKKAAKNRIVEIDDEISNLRNDMKPEY